MPLESLPKMKRRPQSDITSALVRQLTCLLNSAKRKQRVLCQIYRYSRRWARNEAQHDCSLTSTSSKRKWTLTSRRRNTRATVSCGQWRPNLRGAVQQFARLLVGQTALNACTWRHEQSNSISDETSKEIRPLFIQVFNSLQHKPFCNWYIMVADLPFNYFQDTGRSDST